MKSSDCELIRQAAMVHADREIAQVPAERVQAHLATCAECRQAVETMQALTRSLSAQRRRTEPIELWPAIGSRLADARCKAKHREPIGFFVAIAVALLLAQAALLVALPALSWIIKAVTVLCIAALLVAHRQNPFHVEPKLVLPEEPLP